MVREKSKTWSYQNLTRRRIVGTRDVKYVKPFLILRLRWWQFLLVWPGAGSNFRHVQHVECDFSISCTLCCRSDPLPVVLRWDYATFSGDINLLHQSCSMVLSDLTSYQNNIRYSWAVCHEVAGIMLRVSYLSFYPSPVADINF